MIDKKECIACLEIKEANEFYKDKRMKTGLSSECKKCVRARNREYIKTYERKGADGKILTPEQLKLRSRGYHLRAKYGITNEEYDELVNISQGRCQICDKESELHVDHCHDTGIVRGLLCFNCNVGLGNFMDSSTNLSNAIIYLNK